MNAEFPLQNGLIYLNHAAVSPWPRRTAEAVRNFALENMTQGGSGYARWLQKEARLREQCRSLLNAPDTGDIALLKNTSEALSVVAYGLSWQAGDNIVIPAGEFPSNRVVWESLQNQGVNVRQADVAGEHPEQALISCMDERTRLLSVSSVQYAKGLRFDLKLLGAHCRAHGILFCIDAIQSLGAIRLDVQAVQADFVMADGHKWLTGPEGLAVFYCRAELRGCLKLHQFGWHMTEDCSNYDKTVWTTVADARRFECGSPNMIGTHALSASLEVLHEAGAAAIETQVLAGSRFLLDGLQAIPGIEVLTPAQAGRYAGIVTFRPLRKDPAAMHRYLSEHGVICARRGGGIRFSPHFYTPRPLLEQALQYVAEYRGD